MTTSGTVSSVRFSKFSDVTKTVFYYVRIKGSQTNGLASTTLGLFRQLPPFEIARLTIHRVVLPNFEGTVRDELNNQLNIRFKVGLDTFSATIELTEQQYDGNTLAAAVQIAIREAANETGSDAIAQAFGDNSFTVTFDQATYRLFFSLQPFNTPCQLEILESSSVDVLGLPIGSQISQQNLTLQQLADKVVFALATDEENANVKPLPNPVSLSYAHSVMLCSNLLTNVESNNNMMYGPIAQMTLPAYGFVLDWENDGQLSPPVLVDYDTFSSLQINVLTPLGTIMRLPPNYAWEMSIQLELLAEQEHDAYDIVAR